MSSSINVAYPQQGAASTANVRSNFAAAVSEIEALQNAVGVGGGSGGTVNIDGGAIDGTVIGGATPAAVTATTLTATTIDGPVGSVTPAAGTFTTLVGTTIDGVVGSVTPAAGTFTTLAGTTIDGPLGSVTPAAATVTTLATTGAVTFNDAGADVDFRVESTGSANMLTVDAGNDQLLVGGNVGIGVTPETDWESTQSAIQVGGLGSVWSSTTQAAGGTINIGTNHRVTSGSVYKYIVNDEAARMMVKDGTFKFYTAAAGAADASIAFGNPKVEIDLAGNVGIGVTPETAWNSNYSVLQMGGLMALWSQTAQAASSPAFFTYNVYLESADYKYLVTDEACRLNFNNGNLVFYTAASGTADTAITWGNAKFTVDVAGNVGVGVSPLSSWESTYTALQVAGLGAVWGSTSQAANAITMLSNNVYFESPDLKYIVTDEASMIAMQGGQILMRVATSGTAGTAISYTEAFKIAANGDIFFGTHSAIGAETVTGYITIKDAGGTERKLAVVS